MNTCKVCGHKALNLEPHISSDHSDIGLEGYIEKFDADIDDIVHPDSLKPKATHATAEAVKKASAKAEAKAPKVETPVAAPAKSGFTFDGVTIPFRADAPAETIPAVDPAYHWPEFTVDVLEDINENKRVMLVGHTGCGKTSLITQLAAASKNGVVRINMNGQTTIGDFVGLWTVKGGETVWVDGALPHAMRNGLWLIVDEIDFAEPAILAVLNGVLERNGYLTLKEKGHEVVKPHPDFRVFATANGVGCMSDYRGSLYNGTNPMNEAQLDRWRVYMVNYLPAEIESKVVLDNFPKLKSLPEATYNKIITNVVRVANLVREAFTKEEIGCTFSTRRLIDWTDQMIRKSKQIKSTDPRRPQVPLLAAESTIFAKISKEDAEIIRGIISRVLIEPARK